MSASTSANNAFGQRNTSPATNTVSGPAHKFALHTTPSRRVNPEFSNHVVAGDTPMPTITTSAGITSPLLRVTLFTRESPSMLATCTLHRTTTPLRSCTAPIAAPVSAPMARISGASRPSSTVTSAPRFFAVAAASKPMNPAPITTTRTPSVISSRNAVASANVRNV
ncbi:unannotated protein [freshwater metagenome]|uniref:Unannotated protein n=1 Tax=freshwater metagenome TaxID=449393 RepID=A0A6J6JWA6_9ZZZZ